MTDEALDQFRRTYGEWATEWMLFLEPLKCILGDLKPEDSDTCWAVASLHLLTFLDSGDPSPVHFRVSRDYLAAQEVTDDEAVDLLARELIRMVAKFRSSIIASVDFATDTAPENSEVHEGLLMPGRNTLSNHVYERDGANLLDDLFAAFLRPYGEVGADASRRVLENSRRRQKPYRESRYSSETRPKSWSLWIADNSSGKHSLFGRFLDLLAEVAWKDICSERWDRKSRNVPALTQGVHPSVARILTHSLDIEGADVFCNERVVGTFLPTVDPGLMRSVIKGIGSLNSLYHHKLIRFECRHGFENWATGKQDYRFLEFSRGCAEIAELIGFSSNQAIEAIKNILYAQAYLEFHFDDGSGGNLIILTKFKSPLSGREEGVRIMLGEKLLPLNAFNAQRTCRLLVPVPELPPFVSSTNSHASQASLQMLVMQRFSDCSIDFLKFGSVHIPQKMWADFSIDVGLSPPILKQTLDRWIRDGDNGPRFLVPVDVDHYSLGKAYEKEAHFLKNQGILRKQQKARAQQSLKVRKRRVK